MDIAEVIAEEIDKPFDGKTVRYVASDEASPNEVAKMLGEAIGKPDLEWKVVSDEQLLNNWLAIGFNEQVARGFVEMQRNQGNGQLYEDYDKHRPELGKLNWLPLQRRLPKLMLRKNSKKFHENTKSNQYQRIPSIAWIACAGTSVDQHH
ncbi:hypothetical protein [Flavobacterium sp. 3HN19-14]|uniref:hypothetical protein n=1 Tax=Flavobacterium sp. 3HN19-14 TaxID=3448133 RepID=UPI003EE299A9